jgi:predicted transcriptional regulator
MRRALIFARPRCARSVLAAAIVHFKPAVVVVDCWPNQAMLAIAVASASLGCCLGVVILGLFGGGGDHDR